LSQNFTPRSQKGQAIVLLALMIVALTAAIGLAVDSGVAYYWNTAAERAAAAGALSGVIFMPDQLTVAIPAGSGNDATDRAVAEAKRNGFDIADTANNVTVTVAPVSGYSNRLGVTVSRSVKSYFMGMFGLGTYQVQRTAIASYLPPLSLGQPGARLGATLAELGSGAPDLYYVALIEGWGVDRENGDPYTTDPKYEFSTVNGCFGQCTPLNPPAQDIHAYAAVKSTDNIDASLPARGGYSYKITIPAGGGRIQIYNAAHDPDDLGGVPANYCDNFKPGTPNYKCSPGGNYQLREGLFVNQADKTTFNAVEYTIFKVNNIFIRSSDQELSQVKILPVDASNWSAATNQYTNVKTGATITQTFDAAGNPTNMSIYHNWVDIASYTGAADGGLVQYTAGYGPLSGALPAGTYRLRVDTLNYDGTLPSGSPPSRPSGTHMYALRAVDPSGNACSGCTVSAWNEMAIYTPISGGSFTLKLFQVTPDYAGMTIGVDIYDPGDISGAGDVQMSILDPTLAVATSTSGINIYDLGVDRSAAPSAANIISAPGNTTAQFAATTAGVHPYNGHWVHIELPIPNSYNPGTNPANWWWSLKYGITGTANATDVITVAISLKGNPAHLISS
jgi:hypothetical protein